MNKFYIYEWYNIDTGEVFYVGKGSGNRYKKISKTVRNIYFVNYINKYHCNVRIRYNNLTEERAFQLEIQTIKKYKAINQCKCNFTEGGEGISGYTHSEKAKEIISKTHRGKKNSQFGISPKDRMGVGYKEWRIKMHENKIGECNPNYNNHFLKKKYQEDPQLALEKQSRKGIKNGMSKKIKLYDKNMNFIKEFDYIGLCCDYLHKNYGFSDNAEVVRLGIRRSIRMNVPYKGFKFIK